MGGEQVVFDSVSIDNENGERARLVAALPSEGRHNHNCRVGALCSTQKIEIARITLCSVVFVHGLFGDRLQTWTKNLKQHKITPDPNLPSSSQPQKNRPTLFRKFLSRDKGVILTDSRTSSEGSLASEGLQQPTSGPFKVFWPRDLLPVRFPDVRIFTWGYEVDIDHALSGASTATVFQHAANLLSDLCDVRISSEAESRPLIFVAHSLGGIVVKDVSIPFRVDHCCHVHLFCATYSHLPRDFIFAHSNLQLCYPSDRRDPDCGFKALNQSLNAPTHQKAIAPATAGVCFLGTPHRGTSIAAQGETLLRISKLLGKSPNLRILQALKYDAETLDRVHTGFHRTLIDARCKLKIRSFLEAEKYLGVLVSFDSSNTALWSHI